MEPYSIWISKHISYIHVIDKLLSIMSALREVLNCVMEQFTLESNSINDDRQLKTRTPVNFIVRLFYSAHITGVLNKFIFLVQWEWVLASERIVMNWKKNTKTHLLFEHTFAGKSPTPSNKVYMKLLVLTLICLVPDVRTPLILNPAWLVTLPLGKSGSMQAILKPQTPSDSATPNHEDSPQLPPPHPPSKHMS